MSEILVNGKEFEEVKEAYLRFYVDLPGQPEGYLNTIIYIEKYKFSGDIEYLISFNHSNDFNRLSVKRSHFISLLRKEKLLKICQKIKF